MESRSTRVSPGARLLPLPGGMVTAATDDEKPVSKEVEDNAPWRHKSETSPTRTTPLQAQSTIAQVCRN